LFLLLYKGEFQLTFVNYAKDYYKLNMQRDYYLVTCFSGD